MEQVYIYIYIDIYICVCVCVCVCKSIGKTLNDFNLLSFFIHFRFFKDLKATACNRSLR